MLPSARFMVNVNMDHGCVLWSAHQMINVQIEGLDFSCRVAGDVERGIPVLLLHGFPETSHIWIPLMSELAKRGYCCVAPNLRGYSAGARPPKTKDYQLQFLCEDAIAIAHSFGFDRFHLIGHDWGAIVGWALLTLFPEKIASFAALSTPHVRALFEAIDKVPEQRKMSRYLGVFRLPIVPEWLLTRRDSRILRRLWKNSSPAQIADFLTVFGDRRGARAALNYYRANMEELRSRSPVDYFSVVHHPVLLIWGNKDDAVSRAAAEGNQAYMKGPFKFVELDAGHWLPTEAEQDVLDHVLVHLQASNEGMID